MGPAFHRLIALHCQGDFISKKGDKLWSATVASAHRSSHSKAHGDTPPWHRDLGAGPQGLVRVRSRHGDRLRPCGGLRRRGSGVKTQVPHIPQGWKVGARGVPSWRRAQRGTGSGAGAVSPLEQGREGRSLPTAARPQAPGGAAQPRSLRSPCRCSACVG